MNNLVPDKYSRWYKIKEKGNKTIDEFNKYIKKKYGVDVTLILSAEDDNIIYEKIKIRKISKQLKKKKEKMDKLKDSKLEDIFFRNAQTICKRYDIENDIFLKIKGFSNNGDYVEFPVIKIES